MYPLTRVCVRIDASTNTCIMEHIITRVNTWYTRWIVYFFSVWLIRLRLLISFWQIVTRLLYCSNLDWHRFLLIILETRGIFSLCKFRSCIISIYLYICISFQACPPKKEQRRDILQTYLDIIGIVHTYDNQRLRFLLTNTRYVVSM